MWRLIGSEVAAAAVPPSPASPLPLSRCLLICADVPGQISQSAYAASASPKVVQLVLDS